MLKNMLLKTKFTAVIAITAFILSCSLFIFNWIFNSTMGNLINDFEKKAFDTENLVLNTDRDMYQANTAFHTIFHLPKESKDFEKAKSFLEENIADVNERMGKINENIQKDNMLKNMQHLETKNNILKNSTDFPLRFKEWETYVLDIISQHQIAGLTPELSLKINEADKLFKNARGQLNEMGETIEGYPKLIGEYHKSNLSKMKNYFYLIMTIIMVSLVFITSRFIGGLINQIEKLVSKQHGVVEKFFVGFNELMNTSQKLSEVATVQASALQQTASTMEETASMVKQNTENTRQAATLSKKTTDSAKEGYSKMTEMNTSMEEIKKSSNDIAKIIKVIDEIAFQTNILALNAAVEAARAGEAGAGFAVVAEEVRNLAGRSANAAKDTTDIIEKNIELSRKGVDISSIVSKSLGDIKENAEKVNSLVSEINTASEEQTKGTDQISKALGEIEGITCQNESIAKETFTSSEELLNDAQILSDILSELNSSINGRKKTNKVASKADVARQ